MNSKEYEIQYLPLFYEDLNNTLTYIKKTLRNPQAAIALLDAVEDAIQERATCAEAFEQFPSSHDRENPYYAIYVNNYVVYYVVLEHKVMEVRRFLYKGRDRWNIL